MKPSLEASAPFQIPYPDSRWEEISESITLSNGITIVIRPICAQDAPLLEGFLSRLSPETIYFRFLSQWSELIQEEVISLSAGDVREQTVIVATCNQFENEKIVAVASYYVNIRMPKIAEAAFMVENGYQAKGVGTHLIERLVACAYGRGIRIFQYFVHPNNVRMFRLIQHSGTVIKKMWEYGMCEVWARLEPKKEHEKWMAQGIYNDSKVTPNNAHRN